jgi:signal transduction histidine kinase
VAAPAVSSRLEAGHELAVATSYAQDVVGPRARAAPGAWHPRVAWAGALVSVGAVALAAAGAPSDAAFGRGLLELLIVGGPIAVGLYALREPRSTSFGVALLGIGFAWSLTALTTSDVSVAFTIGRLATWLIYPCVVYLLLAYPRGRIEPGLDRALFAGVVGVMVVLFFGTAPFVQGFPGKTLWSSCTTDCPSNALFVLDAQPAFLTDVVLVREWLVELLWLGLFVSMVRRWRGASLLQRRAVGPAFAAGALLGVVHCGHITCRQLAVATDTVVALSSVWTFCIVVVCAAFLFGLVRKRVLLAGTLGALSAALRAGDDRADMRDALRVALGDRTTDLLVHDPGSEGWRDTRGETVQWPQPPGQGRAITVIDTGDGRQDVALVHDVALLDDPELLDGVRAAVLASWRHERLTAELAQAMTDLDESRRRIAEAADVERERIQRDLHDGAQQRLVALRIRLSLAEELLTSDPAAGTEAVRELGFEAERALDELRSFAHQVYPPQLTALGLADALRSVSAQAPNPVRVTATGVTRHPIEIESAVYFTCVEALQNAIKHAHGATGIWIGLAQNGATLRFEVHDDGAGFVPGEHDGRGLRNMRDRIEAVGGEIAVAAEPGRGTRVVGSVPLA